MDQKAIFALCKKLGCCDACGLRYLGIRNPKAYENSKEFALKFQDPPAEQLSNGTAEGSSKEPVAAEKPSTNGDSPPTKKHKANPCVSCLGVLQEDVWAECNDKVKEMLDKKRYVKRSRALPQTPWVVCGRRVVDSSVQEIIFQPLAAAYQLSAAEAEHRLKFLAAGREDVDVRCLGDGRPFAIEVTDPRRELTAEELSKICEEISSSGQVVVKKMVPVTREDLADLKKGEENKCKTYEALCIKLTHSDYDTAATPDSPVTVTPEDIRRLNAYRNTAASHAARVSLTQRTPVRVLHRRPLLARERLLYDVYAEALPEHPQLLVVRMRTSAGAYVKEAVHGELGRTRPALGVGVGARLDLLALDVAAVHLDWPNNKHDG